MDSQNKSPHISVLMQKTIYYLNPTRGGNFLDATLGYGGHAEKILSGLSKSSKQYRFIGLDRDAEALTYAQVRLQDYLHTTFFHRNFQDAVLLTKPITFDGILLDLGISSPQLDDPSRGFSFIEDGPLDMRMDQTQPLGRRTLTAHTIINQWSQTELTRLFSRLGQQPYARSIARTIVSQRAKKPINTTKELVAIIERSTPPSYRFGKKTHFATNVFRALRMAVNDELETLESFLKQLPHLANYGCRIVIISFHSLEDRLVKHYFKNYADDGKAKMLTKKPIEPTIQEIDDNPRSRSAKLRALEWL